MEKRGNVKKFIAEINPGDPPCCRYGTADEHQKWIIPILESIADMIIQKPKSNYCSSKIPWEGG